MTTLVLKILAIVFMFIDHLGFSIGSAAFAEIDFNAGYYLCRALGRLAFPIFAFLIANGFKHTGNVKNYALRLLAFAVISEVPFDYFVSGKLTIVEFGGMVPNLLLDNVFFTLFLGLLFLCLNRYYGEKIKKFQGIASAITLFVLCALSGFVSSDYGAVGVMWVALFGLFDISDKSKTPVIFLGAALLSYWRIFSRCVMVAIYRLTAINIMFIPGLNYIFHSTWNIMAWIQPFALVAVGIIFAFNGKSGMPENKTARKTLQYAFYLFYPLHILVLYLIFK